MDGKRTIGVASLLTALWLFALFALVGWSEKCAEEGSFSEVWLVCRTSNEIGDFLAGAFAPLAFLWLVVTVIIQSAALKKQSDELELAREEQVLIRNELRLTRAATEAQLEEARKNLELIGSQIEIERMASRSTLERQADDAIERAMVSALGFFNKRISGKRVLKADGRDIVINLTSNPVDVFHDFQHIGAEIERVTAYVMSNEEKSNVVISPREDWLIFAKMVREIVNLGDNSSVINSVFLETFGLLKLNDNLKDILSVEMR